MPTQQFSQTVVLTLPQAKQAVMAQNALIKYGFGFKDYTLLVGGLASIPATIVSLLFWLSPGTTFAAALIAAMATMLPSEIDSLDDMAKEGLSQLSDVENLMVGTNVDQVEVRLPYLEYQYPDSSKNWRFVDGRGIISLPECIPLLVGLQ